MAPHSTGVNIRLTSPVVMLVGGPEYERARARRRRGLVRPSNSTAQTGESPAPSRAPSRERGRSLAPSAAASRAASPMGRITEDGPADGGGADGLAPVFVPPGPSRGRSASRRGESPAPLRDPSLPRGRSSSAGPGTHARVREPVTTGSGTAEEEAAADEPEPAFLRGLLTLNLSKPSRIREISVKLKGVARTDWPEGIGPRRLDVMEENVIINVTHSFFSAAANNMQRRAASVDPHAHRASHDDEQHRGRRAASVMPSRDTSVGRAYLGQDSAIHHRSPSVDGISLGLQLGPPVQSSLSRIASSTELNNIAEAEHLPLPTVIGREWGPSPAYEAVATAPNSPATGPAQLDGLQDVPELGAMSLSPPVGRYPSRGPLSRGNSSPQPSPLGPSRVASGEFNPLNRTSSSASGESSASHSSATSGSGLAGPVDRTTSRPDSINERGRPGRLLPHLSIDSSAGPSTASSGTPASYPTSPAASIHSPSRRSSGVLPAASALPSALRNASGSRHPPPAARSASSRGTRFSLAGLSDALRGKSVSRTRDSSRDTRVPDESRGRSRDASPDTVRNSERGVSRGRKTALKSIRDALTGADATHDDGAGSDEEGEAHAHAHQHNWKEFRAGTYTYPISIAVPGSLPPSILADFGYVSYTLKASVVRAGALTANLSSSTEVLLVSAPGTEDTEEAESIVVERFWETQMKYHVALSGKAFPIGGRIPITIRLSPMAKVKLYRITATLEQKTTYYAVGRKLTRHETPKKFPLLRIDFKDPREPLLPIMSDDPNVLKEHPLKDWFVNVGGSESNETPSCLDPLGPWALESFIPLPDCSTRVGFTTNHEKANISVSHVVKVTLRVERGDDEFLDSKGKRKLWDVIIEAPVHLLSCRCTQTILPPYAPSTTAPGSPNGHGSSAGVVTPFSQPPDCGAHGTPRPHNQALPLHLTPAPPAPGRSASRERVEPPTTSIEQTLLFERLVSGEVGEAGEVPPSYREVAVDEEEAEAEGRGRSVTRAV